MKTKLLVPTDFTEVAHTAIQHAARLAETIKGEVVLLNVVSRKDDSSRETYNVELLKSALFFILKGESMIVEYFEPMISPYKN